MDLKEIQYFGRHLVLPNFGLDGQQTLKHAHVVVIGAGGLGSSCLIHLASLGIGQITIVDYDVVEFSNLHRQIIYGVKSLGRLKVEVAAERCADLNPFCAVKTYPSRLTPQLCDEVFPACSLIVDCVDNLPTRLLISDGALKFAKPVVSGSALRTHGQLLKYNLTPNCIDTYRSLLYPLELVESNNNGRSNESQSCNDQGVLGPVPGLIGNLMALEAIKILQKKKTGDNFYTFNWLSTRNPFQSYTLKPKGHRQTFVYKPEEYISPSCSTAIAPSNMCHEIEWSELIEKDILVGKGVISQSACSIDVRPKPHSDVWTLKGNNFAYPLDILKYDIGLIKTVLDRQSNEQMKFTDSDLFDLEFCGPMKQLLNKLSEASKVSSDSSSIKSGTLFVFCKRGISSKLGCKLLLDLIEDLKRETEGRLDSAMGEQCCLLAQLLHQDIFNVKGGVTELCRSCEDYQEGCPVV